MTGGKIYQTLKNTVASILGVRDWQETTPIRPGRMRRDPIATRINGGSENGGYREGEATWGLGRGGLAMSKRPNRGREKAPRKRNSQEGTTRGVKVTTDLIGRDKLALISNADVE